MCTIAISFEHDDLVTFDAISLPESLAHWKPFVEGHMAAMNACEFISFTDWHTHAEGIRFWLDGQDVTDEVFVREVHVRIFGRQALVIFHFDDTQSVWAWFQTASIR